jgi:hypothetical protein
MAYSCGKRSYIEWCSRKESRIAWLSVGVWQLRGMRKNMGKGRTMSKTRNYRLTFLNEKWLNMNKEIAYRKILRCTNKDQTRNLGN